jgi:hypothetical protein
VAIVLFVPTLYTAVCEFQQYHAGIYHDLGLPLLPKPEECINRITS